MKGGFFEFEKMLLHTFSVSNNFQAALLLIQRSSNQRMTFWGATVPVYETFNEALSY